MHGSRSLVITAFIGAALASLTGCGGTASSPTSGAHWVVPSSAAIAGPSIGDTVDAATLNRQVRQAMRGAGSCEITITGEQNQGHGQMRLDSHGMDLSMEVQLSGRTIAVRLLPGAIYVDVHELVPGTTWVKVRPNGTDALPPLVRAVMRTMPNVSDPLALGGPPGVAPKTLVVVGHTQVDGVATSEYAAETVLTTEQVASLMTPDQRSLAGELAGSTVRFEEFIDADHLPRRIVVELTQPDGTQVAETTEYMDWGIPVTVTAPPRSDVTDLTKPTT